MKTAIYARCSTTEQNPDMQLTELRGYAQRRGLQVVGEFVDHGVSGLKESRPQLNRLLVLARERKIDCLLVWKVDRLGRSLRHLVNTLAELEAMGVAFISYKDALDFSTPAGRLMFNVIGAMAQFERDLIRERVVAGQRAAKARGTRFGRPKLVVDAQRIAKLRAGGMSFSEIACQLGVGVATVHRTSRLADVTRVS